jgi:hypothetical protein
MIAAAMEGRHSPASNICSSIALSHDVVEEHHLSWPHGSKKKNAKPERYIGSKTS